MSERDELAPDVDVLCRIMYVEQHANDMITEHDSDRRTREEYERRAGEHWDAGRAGWSRYQSYPRLARAILAAGYRRPRVVTTVSELDALPDKAVVRDSSGDVAEKRGSVWCAFETAPMTNHRLAKYAPILVLHEPEAS